MDHGGAFRSRALGLYALQLLEVTCQVPSKAGPPTTQAPSRHPTRPLPLSRLLHSCIGLLLLRDAVYGWLAVITECCRLLLH